MAADLEKKIDLTLEGVETELDKSLLEAIKDPLTHIVRNCCDHGIETVAERKKVNKPETGHILIRSYHEGGQVVIEVSDDGRGINRAKVIQKALEKGVVSSEKAEKLSDREIFELIFLPGFSTSQHVTAVSGRGVGMDVVRTNVEKIGGNVEVKSFEGKGTSIQLRIPLTLAIVPALVVKSGQCKFAIPQVKLVELVRAESVGAIGSGVHMERLQGRPTCRLRGQLLPLYDIREITKEEFDSEYKDGTFIVVLSAEGSNFGLLVSEVLDTADIVVKPLSSLLNNLAIFSAASLCFSVSWQHEHPSDII
jgi:two-component system chemotaxis sensor kinase CheA